MMRKNWPNDSISGKEQSGSKKDAHQDLQKLRQKEDKTQKNPEALNKPESFEKFNLAHSPQTQGRKPALTSGQR